MKKEEKVLEREESFVLPKETDLEIFYKNLDSILKKLDLETIYEDKTQYNPSKRKLKPKIKAIKQWDQYTKLEVELKFKIAKPLSHETKSENFFKVAISYKANLVTEIKEDSTFTKTSLFKSLFKIFHKRVHSKEIERYKKSSKKALNKLTNEIRKLYHLPGTIKE